MIYFDTETVGLHGIAVLIQWAKDNGKIYLHNVIKCDAIETMRLIESFCEDEEGVCGFNLAFDWFHLVKLYNILKAAVEKHGGDFYVEDHVDLLASVEKDARDGVCLKPKTALDLMLHARKGPYQSTMDRSDIRIRRIPTQLATNLAEELDKRLTFPDIYFERRKDKNIRWQVQDIDDTYDFKNVILKFAPSSALKALAVDALKIKEDHILKFFQVDPPSYRKVDECGWAPFHSAITDRGSRTWPIWVKGDANHWEYMPKARKYAEDDVFYTRALHKFFSTNDSAYATSDAYDREHMSGGDDDSILACCVGAVRWKGFAVDIEGIKELKTKALEVAASAPRDPRRVQAYLEAVMDDTEKLALRDRNNKVSTGKLILEEIATWEESEAATRAKAVLTARKAKKEVELYDKLITAGRLHASFKVIGTKSSRMSGADGLNPQGIDRRATVRSKFSLAFTEQGFVLSGGDFSSFENNIAAADYDDPELTKLLLSGKKLQGIIGEAIYDDMSYDDILATDGAEEDFYTKSKQANYAFLYGGDEHTWEDRIGISEDIGAQALERLNKRFPGIERARQEIHDSFCSMRQPGGIGTQVIWHDPADYVESLLGFRRYFTLENEICKTLFTLANDPPESWKDLKIKVVRRDRLQTASGATQSALFGAAFQIQAANLRAAANHRIQSTGGQITKTVQRKVWDLQPKGPAAWEVIPMNVHDEIQAAHIPELEERVEQVVQDTVASYKDLIPLIKMDWKKGLTTWKGK